ncbi:unnamed protein product [Prorocentrum cordatum]|uniref:Uncharacterized protein n=1 Tax=Prorocentrum cordatum TaxID=2364126 RepID=A0ABN9UL88_9DINO|nr:unnamed protein product [Polarella glacialis]
MVRSFSSTVEDRRKHYRAVVPGGPRVEEATEEREAMMREALMTFAIAATPTILSFRTAVWQWHPSQVCYRGRASACLQSASFFSRGSVGERLRASAAAAGPAEGLRQATSAHPQLAWAGQESDYAVVAPMEPYGDGPEELSLTTFAGERYVLRRSGPGPHELHVAQSCWSATNSPHECCSPGSAARCWHSSEHWSHCCGQGVTSFAEHTWNVVYDIYVSISEGMGDGQLQQFQSLLPGFRVDEGAWDRKRLRWRIGGEQVSPYCHSRGSGNQVEETGSILTSLVAMLAATGAGLSRTFVNVGAGTCRPPDPMYDLLHSERGRGFRGLAVDANSDDLAECPKSLANATADVRPVLLAVEPATVGDLLTPHLRGLFSGESRGAPFPLDILVVDIDGCDCLVAEDRSCGWPGPSCSCWRSPSTSRRPSASPPSTAALAPAAGWSGTTSGSSIPPAAAP